MDHRLENKNAFKANENQANNGIFFVVNSSGEEITSLVVSYYTDKKENKVTQNTAKLNNFEMTLVGCEFTYYTGNRSGSDYWDIDFRTKSGKAFSYRKNMCNIRYYDNGVIIITITKNFKVSILFSSSGGCHTGNN